MFYCLDGTIISSALVFDGLDHCSDGEDEANCLIYFPKSFCHLIINRNMLYRNSFGKQMYDLSQVLNQSMCVLEDSLIGEGFGEPLLNLCEYTLDSCGHLKTYKDGWHLINCTDFTCSDVYFKCPGYYCVHKKYVCDGDWDCPHGFDESGCTGISCPGEFKCKNASICLSVLSVCDHSTECPYMDDELLCNRPLPNCHRACNCLGYLSTLSVQGFIVFPGDMYVMENMIVLQVWRRRTVTDNHVQGF